MCTTSVPDQPLPSLFSSIARAYDGPRGRSESDYSFLDRSSREACQRGRETLDDWYRHLATPAQASIRARFISADPGHHLGALLELYLHEAFLRLEYDIDLDVGAEDPDLRRPDFLLEKRGLSFFLEASAALGADVLGERSNRPRVAALYEAIDRVTAPAFFVSVDIEQCGPSTPGRRQVTEPIQRWLDDLDPDAILADMRNNRERPQCRLVFDGWEVRFQAIPVSQEHRSDPNHRVLGSHTEGVALLDDAAPLRAKLKRKAGHYGELDRPYVVGLLCAGDFVEDRDIADALLGSITLRYSPATQEMATVRAPDGFWYGADGPKNTRVSAVITIPQLSWHALAAAEPTVWVQPWAARPLSVDLPWRTHSIAADGHITTTEAACTSAELFALPAGWPAS